jgi:hypothetical protein
VVDKDGVKTLKRQGSGDDGYGTMRMGTMTLRRKHGKPLTTLPPAPPVIQKGDETKYPFSEYAAKYFQGSAQAVKGGSATLKRKAASVNELMGYVTKPIKESLLPLKYELQKLAVQTFAGLLLYLSNGPPKTNKTEKWKPVRFVIEQALTVPDMRDEIYCQIIKQSINNSHPNTLPRAWQMLTYCVCCFLPSPTLMPYLAAYIYNHRSSSGEIGLTATYALKRLERSVANKINRTRPPSFAELEIIRQLKLFELPVHLPGGAIYKFEIDSATQAGEVIALLSNKISIPDPVGYALYEVYDAASKLETSLGMYEYVPDSIGKPEIRKIVFKKKLFLRRKELPESYPEQKLMCHQTAEDIVDGSFAIPNESDVMILAGWMLQVRPYFLCQRGYGYSHIASIG